MASVAASIPPRLVATGVPLKLAVVDPGMMALALALMALMALLVMAGEARLLVVKTVGTRLAVMEEPAPGRCQGIVQTPGDSTVKSIAFHY